jgi:hypothetical protein
MITKDGLVKVTTRSPKCPGCGIPRVPGPNFYVDKRDGTLRPKCKICTVEDSKKRQAAHKPAIQRKRRQARVVRLLSLAAVEMKKLDGPVAMSAMPRALRKYKGGDQMTYEVTVRSLGVFETKVRVEAEDTSDAQERASRVIKDPGSSLSWRALDPQGIPDTEHVERIG